LQQEVKMTGLIERDSVFEHFVQADLFVSASWGEGLPVAVLEAMACGVPVVQPRRGGFPEIQANTSGGILFEPGDAQGLADGIRSVLLDEELARSLKRNGVEGVHRHYSVGRMADRTMTLYDSLQQPRREGETRKVSEALTPAESFRRRLGLVRNVRQP
jgi:glycosyltransferase involved in cell wall biosynthesis